MGRPAANRAGTGHAARRRASCCRKTIRPRTGAHPALGRVARRRRPAAGRRVPGAHGGRAGLAWPGAALRPGRGLRRRVDRRRRMDPAFGRHRPALGRHGHPRLGGRRRRRAVRCRLRAGPLYGLVSGPAALLLLGAAGVAGLLLSLRFGQLVAAVGLAASFITPALVSSSDPSLPGLFAYLLFVSAASWAVVRWTAWIWLGWGGRGCRGRLGRLCRRCCRDSA